MCVFMDTSESLCNEVVWPQLHVYRHTECTKITYVHHIISETCSCDHLYSETTWSCPNIIVALFYNAFFASIKRPPLFKDHFFWPKRGRLIQVSLYYA